MNILLVRHGETPWNREGRYQGRTDIALSSDGERQVHALASRLAHVHIDVAIASPLTRACRTAEAILANRNLQLELDDDLVEISHGSWEGQLVGDLEHLHAAMLTRWRETPGRDVPAGPDAETLGDVERRAWPVLDRIVKRTTGTALIVAHDAVNRVLLCRVLGLPLERVWKFHQSPAALNVLSGPSLEELQVVRLNDSDHSAPLLRDAQHRAI